MDTTMKLTSPLGEVSNNEIVQQMTGNLGWWLINISEERHLSIRAYNSGNMAGSKKSGVALVRHERWRETNKMKTRENTIILPHVRFCFQLPEVSWGLTILKGKF
jgi:hypothetical protein